MPKLRSFQIDTAELGQDPILQTGVNATVDHTNILNVGTNTHAQIDSHIADATIHSSVYQIDITTGVGSPLGIIETTLPSGWATTYNSVGNFTITHNLGNSQIGFALSVLYNGASRVITPTSITTNAVTFQIADLTDTAVEGNAVGKLLF